MVAGVRIRKVLLPIDGSDASFHAAKYAVKIAKQSGASLTCIHAVRKPAYFYQTRYTDWMDEYYDEAKKHAETWFGKVRSMASKENMRINTDTITAAESIVDEIVKYAEQKNIDLIVMGTKGKTGLRKFLLGSVASGVTLHSHCPVLVVR